MLFAEPLRVAPSWCSDAKTLSGGHSCATEPGPQNHELSTVFLRPKIDEPETLQTTCLSDGYSSFYWVYRSCYRRKTEIAAAWPYLKRIG